MRVVFLTMSFIKVVSTVLNKSSQAVEKLDKAIDNNNVVQNVSGKWNSLRFKVADVIRPTTTIEAWRKEVTQ
tara:strand:- start:902 stop:1117 length:216 start_codon:yes stop_codon:yes gene_type:complete